MNHELVNFDESKTAEVVELWFAGWYEAHSKIIPDQLIKLRTRESFRERLLKNTANTRIAISGGDVLGLCMLKDDELYQMYVSPKARGTGLAQALITDADNRFQLSGYKVAWLACAIGNDRAKRFYEKCGWRFAGVETVDLDTSEGAFSLDVWRFEKDLA